MKLRLLRVTHESRVFSERWGWCEKSATAPPVLQAFNDATGEWENVPIVDVTVNDDSRS